MDAIKYILGFIWRLVIGLLLLWLVLWMVSIFFPSLSIKSLFGFGGQTSTSTQSWLPAPRNMKNLFGLAQAPDGTTNVYTPGPAYNGYTNAYNNNVGGAQVDFVTYTTSGKQIIHNGATTVDLNAKLPIAGNSGYAEKSLYIRNLSIYEGGHIYTGISFEGEARSTMFKDGKFPIIIVDNAGRVATVSVAEAATNWSVPGWTRFQAKINAVLPNKVPCTMVFQSAGTYSTTQPIRVAIPILCN